MEKYDVIVIGGGAAGSMCGIESAKRGRKTLLIEHNKQIGNKILISGGGRCNFVNIGATPEHFISENRHFMKSSLSRYDQYDFINLVEEYKIEYYEKTLGQLFCKKSSREIINLLLSEANKYGLIIKTKTKVLEIKKINDKNYHIRTGEDEFNCNSLVIATGGLSFPNRGATDFAYKIAEQFDLEITKISPGLVPLKLDKNKNFNFELLSGLSINVIAKCNNYEFKEAMLFTHKGVSGPAILQISNYRNNNNSIFIKIEPDKNIPLEIENNSKSSKSIKNFLTQFLPKKFVEEWCNYYNFNKNLNQLNIHEKKKLIDKLNNWELFFTGTEGYKKAEITLGGISTSELSSKTMEVKKHPGLFFIGEAVDVSGWLGGYNFTWAWSCGWVAGQYV
jgi:hypothetical protein